MSFLRKTLSFAPMIVAGLVGFGLVGCENAGSGNGSVAMKTQIDSMSYAAGLELSQQLKGVLTVDSTIKWNTALIREAMDDVLSDAQPRMADTVIQQVVMAFQTQLMAKAKEKQQQEGSANAQNGSAFLAENKGKPGVQTTASGLQYIVEEAGSGDSPDSNDIVTVNYRGTLIDGTVFDESKGNPIEFPVNGVIRGWTEALLMMKPGAKFKLFIPGNLAYGERGGPGGKIGPNETLIFDVELLSFKKQ